MLSHFLFSPRVVLVSINLSLTDFSGKLGVADVKSEALKELGEDEVPRLDVLVKLSLLKLESLSELGDTDVTELDALVKSSVFKLESLKELGADKVPALDALVKYSLAKLEAIKELGDALVKSSLPSFSLVCLMKGVSKS